MQWEDWIANHIKWVKCVKKKTGWLALPSCASAETMIMSCIQRARFSQKRPFFRVANQCTRPCTTPLATKRGREYFVREPNMTIYIVRVLNPKHRFVFCSTECQRPGYQGYAVLHFPGHFFNWGSFSGHASLGVELLLLLWCQPQQISKCKTCSCSCIGGRLLWPGLVK